MSHSLTHNGVIGVNMTRNFGKIVKIHLPDLGEGTKEATIKEWYVQPGSIVNEFDDLVEVFTDKLVAKIPSTCTGIVKSISFKEYDVCLVGHALMEIESTEDGEEPTAVTPEQPEEKTPKQEAAAPIDNISASSS